MRAEQSPNRVGLMVFWIAVIWMISWALLTVPIRIPLLHSLTLDEYNQTIWAHTGPLGTLYGVSVPLGGVIAAVGVLIYSGARGTAWKVGLGLLAAFSIAMMTWTLYLPPLFGIGGTLILLSFIGILWFWAGDRKTLSGSAALAADFGLAGHVLFLMAAWFT